MDFRVNSTFRISLILVTLGLAVWSVTLSFGFVWDDFPTIVSNPHLQHWSTLGKAWFHDYWGLHEVPEHSGYWRPVPTVIYAFFTLLTGTSPLVFHALNVLLHLSNSVLLVNFLFRLSLSGFPLFFASLFFCLHPLVAESVSFVSALPDLLAIFWGMSALLLWSSPKVNFKRSLGAGLCLILALLSKESAVSFVGVLLFAPWIFPKDSWIFKFKKQTILTLFLFLTFYLILHVWVTGGMGTRSLWGDSLSAHLATVIRLAPFSFFLTFFPVGGSPTRTFPISPGFQDPLVWSALFTVLTLAVLCVLLWKKHPWFGKGIFLYILFWLPSSNLIPAEGLIADRYLYLPCMGTAFLLGHMIKKIVLLHPKALRLVTILFLAIWAIWAFQSARIWRSNETLWQHAVQASPESSVAWNEWGNVLLQKSEFEQATQAFNRAIFLRPNYREAYFNRIVGYFRAKKFSKAQKEVEVFLLSHPDDAAAWDLRGTLALYQGQKNLALTSAKKAVELAPHHWKYHYNYGLTLLRTTPKFEEALHSFKSARELAGDQPKILMNIAASHYYLGQWRKAKETYLLILKKHPNHKGAIGSLKAVEEMLQLRKEG